MEIKIAIFAAVASAVTQFADLDLSSLLLYFALPHLILLFAISPAISRDFPP
jgi:hypothetical protein